MKLIFANPNTRMCGISCRVHSKQTALEFVALMEGCAEGPCASATHTKANMSAVQKGDAPQQRTKSFKTFQDKHLLFPHTFSS